ncbi:hypothetical protein QQS21_010782 [Conoideocrella luteorostrata]|uniref:DNA-directed DNA polymerase n=1 Tax=Conoideocrella luteorostrata TaxID=1105319 RepID=A0AAJ0CH25_9HYPO|nr:hypothetical protein QQS21_010782 [Conoideocrella luteorostrata]
MTFASTEQYMMYRKAEIFGDIEAMTRIISGFGMHPAEHKKIGGTVRNFDSTIWDCECMSVVIIGNLCKFTQNAMLRDLLMSTGQTILVESSPTDRIWGRRVHERERAGEHEELGAEQAGQGLDGARRSMEMNTEPFMSALELDNTRMDIDTDAFGNICIVRSKTSVDRLDAIMDMDWVIISSWIEDESISKSWDNVITDVSFRLAKNNTSIILVTDVPLAVGRDVVINLDADDPGANPEIITNMRQSIQKLRAVSISGYSPLTPRGLGMATLSIMGLDIEVTTHERGGGMPLPHDPIISIVVSNGGWYDKEFEDKCYCLYAFGKCGNINWPEGRNAYVARVSGNEEATRETYKIINMLSPDFVNVHNGFNFDLRCLAASSALDPMIGPTFSERRLGNVGVGIFWRLDNGTMVVDSMYTAATEPTSKWPSLALAKMSERFDMPPKMDSGTMAIRPNDSVDVTDMIEYNARDSDLHVWLPKNMLMCERLCILAGVSRSTMWDAVANNTAQSEALKRGMILDLGRNTRVTDDIKYKGGFVVTPTPGCYEGVAMLDGSSLYGFIMKHLQIYVDRCVSAPNIEALRRSTPSPLPDDVEDLNLENNLTYNEHVIAMKIKRAYISVLQGEETLLGEIIGALIQLRVYGDTDSIFPWVGGKTKDECDDAGMNLKRLIDESLSGTPFENVKADLKGNYKYILITTRKKYSTVEWNGTVETKGMAPVKRDTIPIAKYVTNNVLKMINTPKTKEEKKRNVTEFLGKTIDAVNNNKLPPTLQMFETKINCQPHYKYKSAEGGYVSVLADSGAKVTNVNKKWVLERVEGATIATILEAADLGTVNSLMFSYRMIVKQTRGKVSSAS